jgi:hypothetical protein
MAVGDQVAALAAAGNDVNALEQAIKAAAHLDDKPGDDRQTLRGEFGAHLRKLARLQKPGWLLTFVIGMQRHAQS